MNVRENPFRAEVEELGVLLGQGGHTLRGRNPMGRVCTGLPLSISTMKPSHAAYGGGRRHSLF